MWAAILRNAVFRKTAREQLTRSFSDGPPPKLLRKYEHFQKDDGIPVYIKGGVADRVLFGITIAGIAVGLTDGLYTLYTMAKPKKK